MERNSTLMKIYNFTTHSATDLAAANRTATTIIKAYFGNTLSTTPSCLVTSTRVVLQLFYYSEVKQIANTSQNHTDKAVNALGGVLSQLYPSQITVILWFVQVQQPYINSSILAQYLAINASKYGFNRLQNMLFSVLPFVKSNTGITFKLNSKANHQLPAHICGVKVQLSGLLTTQRAAPRKTVYTASAGTFHGAGTTTEYASAVAYPNPQVKSRVGAFNIKVYISIIKR